MSDMSVDAVSIAPPHGDPPPSYQAPADAPSSAPPAEHSPAGHASTAPSAPLAPAGHPPSHAAEPAAHVSGRAELHMRLLPPPPLLAPAADAHPPPVLACPALHTATYPEPILRRSVPIRVLPRGGAVGPCDKVEWRLIARPRARVATGMRVALCDIEGSYRFVSRSVGPIVGADQRWVTFLLSAGISAPATTQTLTVPRADAGIPLLLRLLLLLFALWLGDEHPFAPTPLPDLE
ncbi:hypothetical protein EIP86_000383 [Pleurotus ostreatoroseus]|nr:hypothetical protein EIP86_000383 [Pleurotus ostreatoroseus]